MPLHVVAVYLFPGAYLLVHGHAEQRCQAEIDAAEVVGVDAVEALLGLVEVEVVELAGVHVHIQILYVAGDDGVDHLVLVEIEVVAEAGFFVFQELHHAFLGKGREKQGELPVVVPVARVESYLEVFVGEHGEVLVAQVARFAPQRAFLHFKGEGAFFPGQSALPAVEGQVGGGGVAVDEACFFIVLGVGLGDAGREHLGMAHHAVLAVGAAFGGGPIDGLGAVIGLHAHLHLPCAAYYKGVAVDKAGMGIDDRAFLVEGVVPMVDRFEVGQALRGEVGVELQPRHGFGHHAGEHVPIVEAIERGHLFPCLFFKPVGCAGERVALFFQRLQPGMHAREKIDERHRHRSCYQHNGARLQRFMGNDEIDNAARHAEPQQRAPCHPTADARACGCEVFLGGVQVPASLVVGFHVDLGFRGQFGKGGLGYFLEPAAEHIDILGEWVVNVFQGNCLLRKTCFAPFRAFRPTR